MAMQAWRKERERESTKIISKFIFTEGETHTAAKSLFTRF